MTNKRLKPRTLGTKSNNKDSSGGSNPALAGGIGARRFGAGKANQLGQSNNMNTDDDNT
jgi:hypothetical protein